MLVERAAGMHIVAELCRCLDRLVKRREDTWVEEAASSLDSSGFLVGGGFCRSEAFLLRTQTDADDGASIVLFNVLGLLRSGFIIGRGAIIGLVNGIEAEFGQSSGASFLEGGLDGH